MCCDLDRSGRHENKVVEFAVECSEMLQGGILGVREPMGVQGQIGRQVLDRQRPGHGQSI